jgi:PDZ domain-containing protein
VRYIEDLFAAAEGLRAGQHLLVEGRSPDGTVHTGALAIHDVDGAPAPWGIGIDVSPIVLAPPPPVSLDLHGLSGSSAGLAGALGVVDALGARPLAGGRRIGVTGTISPDGRVGPIADIRYKAATARRAGATLMVVPATQAAAARRHAHSMTVIGVSTLGEAVTALGGAPCASPS